MAGKPKLETVPAEYVVTRSDVAAVDAGYRWGQYAVDHVYRFAESLRDPMDPDKPYRLLTWQDSLTRPLFGWRRPDGRRRFTRLNLWVPKKNGKTSWLSFLGLVFLLADGERRPGCYAASSTGEAAEDIYVEAVAMLTGTPWRRVLEFRRFRHSIECPPNGGIFKTLAASAEGAEGLKGSFVVIDEVHATLRRKPKLLGALRYAGSGRREPLTATVSTAGDDRQALPFKVYTRAKSILRGDIIDRRTLAAVWEAAEKKDDEEYTDAELVAANPGVGEVLDLDQLRDDYEESKSSDHGREDFRRYRLGVWTKRSTAWLNVVQWAAGFDPDVTPAALAGRDCYVGVDLSTVLDLTAACATFPLEADRFAYLFHFWLPNTGIDDRVAKEMDYRAAEKAGHITLIDGPKVDYDYVEKWIADLGEVANVRQVGFDPYRAKHIAKHLEDAGYDCVAIPQGWKISEPCQKFGAMIANGDAVHAGNSVMAWCIENGEIRRGPTGQIRLVKPIDKRKRIDGLVAAVQGTFLAMFAEDEGFVYG